MSVVTGRSTDIGPDRVHETLRRHMLADGLDVVLDLDKSRGAWLHDARQERRFLDFFTSFSSYPLGYNHPGLREPDFTERLLEAAILKPSNPDLYTTLMAEFVATFARIVPAAYRQHLFFVSGGALAVENALKTAFDWKVRKNLAAGRGERGHLVIHFQQAFHGRSGYTLSLTNTADPRKTAYFPKFDWPRVKNPKLRFPITDEVLVEVEAAEQRAIEAIEEIVAESPHEVAALILEPIQGEGGDNHFRGEFLRALRRLADEHEFLLVFDEVQTGFATTGRWWCFEHFDVEPDVFAFGKKTQVCGIAATGRIDDVESVFHVPSRINSTWGGNLVDMVRCQRFIEIIEEDELVTNAAARGEELCDGLEELAEELPDLLSNARGRGLFAALDLPSPELRDTAFQALRREGLLALRCGPRSIRFRPPLIVSSAEIADGIERIGRALDRVSS